MSNRIKNKQNICIKKGMREAWFDNKQNPQKRYFLEKRWQEWEEGEKVLGAIMMNPSNANEIQNDSTVNRLIKYASKNGYVALNVVNVIPIINSKSKELKKGYIAEVKENQQIKAFQQMFDNANDIYLGWGKIGQKHLPTLLESKELKLRFTDHNKNFFVTAISPKGFPYHPQQRLPLLPSLNEDTELKDISEKVRKWIKNK